MAAAGAPRGGEAFAAVHRPNYPEQEELCFTFLRTFRDRNGRPKYMDMLKEIAHRRQTAMEIALEDIDDWRRGEDVRQLVDGLQHNVQRYVALFSNAIDKILQEEPELARARPAVADVFDILMRSREKAAGASGDSNNELGDSQKRFPDALRRRYELYILPKDVQKPESPRSVDADRLGALVTIRGIVTRVSDVRPRALVVSYVCDTCGDETYQVVNAPQFMPLAACESDACQERPSGSRLLEQSRFNKYVKFQELKLQELPESVPRGSVPRSMTVYLQGERTGHCFPGDRVTLSGAYLPIARVNRMGGRAAAGLTQDAYLETYAIHHLLKGLEVEEQNPDLLLRVEEEVARVPQDELFDKLAGSIAPEIFGLEPHKKALLLMMAAGVTKHLSDGLRIRGDINVLFMGDPGVAKSQLLKHISTIAPRAVYTTGRGSSGVGLTAAVVRDKSTHDVTLEAGALVLADKGICSIDEFDKMDEADRTAIYEVMEQQTVSIAKAGITTTLNARAAILAAANPLLGRYNKKLSPEKNINLPAALLSRFDVTFVIVDTPNERDLALAEHICRVHQTGRAPKRFGGDKPAPPAPAGRGGRRAAADDSDVYDSDFLRAYVARARVCSPTVPKALQDYIAEKYVHRRQYGQDNELKSLLATPRTLLSILRLAQARARLRLALEVTQADVDEAWELLAEAARSTQDDVAQDSYEVARMRDTMSKIFNHVKKAINQSLAAGKKGAKVSDLNKMLLHKGFPQTEIDSTMDEYLGNLVLVQQGRSRLSLG